VKEFEKEFLTLLESQHADVLAALKAGQFSDELTDVLAAKAKEVAAKF
jgi:F-type H+-transporting ATPase subunit alpha